MSPTAAVMTCSTQKASSEIKRPIANFRPSIWGDVFLKYINDDSQSMEVNETMERQMQAYKEEVKKMFLSYSNNDDDVFQKLSFIDLIQRLGVSYHFKHEINEALEQIHYAFTNNTLNLATNGEASALHRHALLFRLLRKNGYRISSDIFKQFKNKSRGFNDIIAQDIQGMWSFYEAAHLRVHGEDILDEALDFTYTNLKSKVTQLSPSLAAQINHSLLRQPLHKELPGLLAKRYISVYEEDPSHNKALLNFAKLNFNVLQRVHQKEIGSNSLWWNKLNFATKVPYTRDRVVESYLWTFHMSAEPQYSTSRRILGKLMTFVTALDDTYDNFGTYEELQILTQAMKRWDSSLIESLPESIKVVFKAFEDMWDEMELVISEEGKSNILLQDCKQEFCNMAEAYLVEAKWCKEGHVPSYDEYKANACITIAGSMMMKTYICLGDLATKEVVDWIMKEPKIIGYVNLLGRLRDDMSTHEFEQQREHVASAVECCMKQHGISKEEAYKVISKEIDDIWKGINEECLKLDEVPRPEELECIVNLARTAELMYENFEDRGTNGELLQTYVAALLLDPIPL